MNVGSLFSGIGGFDLGLERAGMSVSWQVENNDYCNRVLTKHWPNVPRYGDIKTVDWQAVETVDLVCGGFPCQPFSCAGERRGQDDDRYLWPEVVRCLDTLRPTWFLGENVPGIINMALDKVCADLENLGYTVWPVCIPACAVDAPHIRQRIWIVGYSAGPVCERGARGISEAQTGVSCKGQQNGHLPVGSQYASEGDRERHVADANSPGLQEARAKLKTTRAIVDRQPNRWPVEPAVGRVAHGVPARVDRLRGLGNAIVPQIAEALGKMILAAVADGEDYSDLL